eukprot:TRINITY_DN453_c0_g1_i1.p2 TRINITY_DN453_c0_g1~~TRINITY_DN453_c0_g1_i1.p2  ORF type:complete len:128 (-),score=34.66 TRINITY_DN453_c0_g1_i1:237-620(-)
MKGTMVVTVIGAHGYNMDTDAYVKIKVEDGHPSEVDTKVLMDTPSPVWGETFTVEVKKALIGHHKLWVYVKDKRLIGGKEIGYCEFKYDDDAQFPSGMKVEFRNHPVDHSWGKVRATLDLDITVTWH